MGTFEKLRKKEDEKISLKPSTELIPDEYEISNDKIRVFFFVASDNFKRECRKFWDNLILIDTPSTYTMNNSVEVLEKLKEISELTSEKKTKLILTLFWGYSKNDGEYILEDNSTLPFYEIWSTLTSKVLKDIPRVFILNVIKNKSTTERDGEMGGIKPYEVPNEANILVIYKQNKGEVESVTFMNELNRTIKEYGEKEDICSIISVIDTNGYTRPILISTMLKKLYVFPNEFRGNYMKIQEDFESTMKEMEGINAKLDELQNGNNKNHQTLSQMAGKVFKMLSPRSSPKPTKNRRESGDKPIPRKSLEKNSKNNPKTVRKLSAASVESRPAWKP